VFISALVITELESEKALVCIKPHDQVEVVVGKPSAMRFANVLRNIYLLKHPTETPVK
jgi:hypothetical protein